MALKCVLVIASPNLGEEWEHMDTVKRYPTRFLCKQTAHNTLKDHEQLQHTHTGELHCAAWLGLFSIQNIYSTVQK